MISFTCTVCHKKYSGGADRYICPGCGASVEPVLDISAKKEEYRSLIETGGTGHGVWRYRALLPDCESLEPVTMGEGETPLQRAGSLEKAYGIRQLYLKNETINPSCTYKDRFSTIALSLFRSENAQAVAIGSAGNAGSSVAAYAAKAGIPCYVILPHGGVFTRAQQAMAYGARFIRVKGEVNDCIELVEKGVDIFRWRNACTTMLHNPVASEGYKTALYEIFRQLDGKLPDVILVPIGGGILLSKIYRACQELLALGLVSKIPRLVGVQAAGCPPVVWAFEHGEETTPMWKDPKTIAGSINDPVTFEGRSVLHAIRASEGIAVAVTEDEIRDAMRLTAKGEGILAEPASAAAIAAVKILLDKGWLKKEETAVCIVTGSGLRDLPLYAEEGENEFSAIDPERPESFEEAVRKCRWY